MTEEEVKLATCQVFAVGKSGTGWIVSPEHILTAYHCVDASEEPEASDFITVRFGVGASATDHEATIVAYDADLDVCLLKMPLRSSCRPIPLELNRPQPGTQWYAFGYPTVKLELGHVLHGVVQQTLTEQALGVDLDLSVQAGSELSSYSGLSGSALMVGPRCYGMLRVSVDRSLGAISFAELAPFLRSNGVVGEIPHGPAEETSVVLRPDFDELLESRVTSLGAGYVLLDGAHGIGKSTFCRNFTPHGATVEVIGAYAFSGGTRGSTPALQAQPEIFVGWLESMWSSEVTGRPARLTERSYSQLIQSTASILQAFANRSMNAGKVGVLFIDGINEAAGVNGDALRRFVDLLPQVLPEGIVIVITGAGLEALASKLGTIGQGAERLVLPALNQNAQRELCRSLLEPDRINPQIVAFLCDRAQGHPLYLRYLIDIVNEGANEEDLGAIPPFSGSIQDYYETIWSQLLLDQDAVNLLGIIARLRWGIPTSTLTAILTPAESMVFVPTLTRIRHLLRDPEKTEIYHSSFSEFVVQKTLALGEWIQGRLTQFCRLVPSSDYGPLNRIYHGLLADPEMQNTALKECRQEWVDQSVLLEAEPDILLGDIDHALAAAARLGAAVDLIRLLLLSQRLSFRYDTLFAQSAALVAHALIALGRTQQALRHILRYDHLIVSPEEAFTVVVILIQAKQLAEAWTILEKIDITLAGLAEREQSEEEFLYVTSLRLHLMALVKYAGGEARFKPFLVNIRQIIAHPENRFSADAQQEIIQKFLGNMLGSALCFEGVYTSFNELPLPANANRQQQVLALRSVLLHAHSYASDYGMTLPNAKVEVLLSDIEHQIDTPIVPTDTNLATVDVLIAVGAKPALVAEFANGTALDGAALPCYTKNRAVPDEAAFDEAFQQLRATFFLHEDRVQPILQPPTDTNWESALQSFGRAIAWCDGTARRASTTANQRKLDEVRNFLIEKILPGLAFPLSARTGWENSYFIPECIVPLLYERLIKLYLDCLPSAASELLDHIDRAFDTQLGIYNEGFRRVLLSVSTQFAKENLDEPLTEQLLDLLFRWKEYVQSNVENRYELIPELLHMIPLFTQLGAAEESLRIYQGVLAVSMGPSWYKEDQSSLMSGALKALPTDADVSDAALQQIAANLEHASGEMTFQRYVRADKGNFIGELCRRKRYADAVSYFKHQSCGSLKQLLEQAREGGLDRVSALVGMRFPGGSLEEQASLLEMLKHIQGNADWRLCWALLEIYQHGDERYLGEWGEAYARIILRISEKPADLTWATSRIQIVAQSMNAKRAWFLLRGLVHTLPDSHSAPFKAMLENIQQSLSGRSLDQLISGYAGRYGPLQADEKATERDTDESSEDLEKGMDALYLPGLFGKQSAIRESRLALDEAKKQLRRRNDSAAVKACIESIKAIQAGGWSIWNGESVIHEAKSMIEDQVNSPDDLARLYGPLALQEHYAERWRIASRLTELFANKFSPEQHAYVMSIAIEHITQIIGETSSERFSYIGAGPSDDASEAALELILWTLDHPQWERRDSAAAMLLWLLRSSDTYVKDVAALACSMRTENRADMASAVLDKLSSEKPVALWQRISPHLDANRIVDQCQHAGRYAALIRIADRAASHQEPSAAAFASLLREKFLSTSPSSTGEQPTVPGYWPPSLKPTWQELIKTGTLTDAAMQRFESVLADVCAPVEVSVAHELEKLLANGFREPPTFPLGRWAGRLRYAMHVALFPFACEERIFQIEAALRTYNPASLIGPANGRELIENLTHAVLNGREESYLPSDNNLVYLDLQCVMEWERNIVQVELLSRLVPPMPQAMRPPFEKSFKSIESPHSGHDPRLAVCGRVHPVITYFGSLTPAVPTPQFLQLLGVSSSATVRYHWRDGASVQTRSAGRRFEASMLAVRRAAFALPPGWRMSWALCVNGEIVTTLDRY